MNSRNTIQRSLILDAVHCLAHPTAEKVYRHIADSYPTISLATVYRNLKQLVGRGELIKISFPDAADHFDTTLRPHYHVICESCGQVEDIAEPYRWDLPEQLGEANGFLITSCNFSLRGICPACREKIKEGQSA